MAASFRHTVSLRFVSISIRNSGRLFGFVQMFETVNLGEKIETVSIFSVSSLALTIVLPFGRSLTSLHFTQLEVIRSLKNPYP